LNNPATVDKYKTAGTISEKVLAEVAKLCVAGEKIVAICEKGDKLLADEVAKVYAKLKNKGQLAIAFSTYAVVTCSLGWL
jgi:methionine aminopeptidase